jgi:hypothetical protein
MRGKQDEEPGACRGLGTNTGHCMSAGQNGQLRKQEIPQPVQPGLQHQEACGFPQIRVSEKSTIFIGNLVSVCDTH